MSDNPADPSSSRDETKRQREAGLESTSAQGAQASTTQDELDSNVTYDVSEHPLAVLASDDDVANSILQPLGTEHNVRGPEVQYIEADPQPGPSSEITTISREVLDHPLAVLASEDDFAHSTVQRSGTERIVQVRIETEPAQSGIPTIIREVAERPLAVLASDDDFTSSTMQPSKTERNVRASIEVEPQPGPSSIPTITVDPLADVPEMKDIPRIKLPISDIFPERMNMPVCVHAPPGIDGAKRIESILRDPSGLRSTSPKIRKSPSRIKFELPEEPGKSSPRHLIPKEKTVTSGDSSPSEAGEPPKSILKKQTNEPPVVRPSPSPTSSVGMLSVENIPLRPLTAPSMLMSDVDERMDRLSGVRTPNRESRRNLRFEVREHCTAVGAQCSFSELCEEIMTENGVQDAPRFPYKVCRNGHVQVIRDETQEETFVRQEGLFAPDPSHELKYGAEHVIRLFIPVSLCMALVVFTIHTTNFYLDNEGQTLLYTPFAQQDSDGTGKKLMESFANALILLVFIAAMTMVLILLYKYKFYKTIHAWLILSSLMLLSIFTTMYVAQILRVFDLAPSLITVFFLIFNFAVQGMICIHWKGPLLMQQGYLIFISALMALTFIKFLPDWTVWTVLIAISIWDLVAVLCPYGPLRMLVETAQVCCQKWPYIFQERNESLFPALIYSSGMLYPYVLLSTVTPLEEAKEDKTEEETQSTSNLAKEVEGEKKEQEDPNKGKSVETASESESERKPAFTPAPPSSKKATKVRRVSVPPPSAASTSSTDPADQPGPSHAYRSVSPAIEHVATETASPAPSSTTCTEVHEERGIKLGLGDFIFYSILVGKASSYNDWNTTIACYIAILIGLCFTLVLLAIFKKALPALPISIFFGLLSYLLVNSFISPFISMVVGHRLVL